jgi:hypothetical protein
MKGLAFVAVIAGVLLVWYLSTSKTRETFVPEFLEQGNVRRTAETSSSSYAQQTNHVIPTPPQLEAVPGIETPFRVNMYNSFQPV